MYDSPPVLIQVLLTLISSRLIFCVLTYGRLSCMMEVFIHIILSVGCQIKFAGDMIEENVKREVHLLKIPPLHFNDIPDILWK